MKRVFLIVFFLSIFLVCALNAQADEIWDNQHLNLNADTGGDTFAPALVASYDNTVTFPVTVDMPPIPEPSTFLLFLAAPALLWYNLRK